jgi:hypothetical protein
MQYVGYPLRKIVPTFRFTLHYSIAFCSIAFCFWMKQYETKTKKTKDSDYWFSLVNAPRNPLGPQPMGPPNPWGPNPWGHPSFVDTSPLGPLSRRTLWTPSFGPPSLEVPWASGAPRPSLVGLVGNPPLSVTPCFEWCWNWDNIWMIKRALPILWSTTSFLYS